MIGGVEQPIEQSFFGVLELTLGLAKALACRVPKAGGSVVICRRTSVAASMYLKAVLGERIQIHVLDRDPYHLSAQNLCDEHGHNLRNDAIERVISASICATQSLSTEIDEVSTVLGCAGAADVLRKFLCHQAGEAFKDQIYLGYHLICRVRRSGNSQATLLLPNAWWSTHIDTAFAGTGLQVVCVDSRLRVMNAARWYAGLRRLRGAQGAELPGDGDGIQSPADTMPEVGRLSDRLGKWRGVRVSGMVFDGLDVGLRNNVGWAWSGDLPLDAFAFFWAVKSRRATAWERRVGALGAHIIDALPGNMDAGLYEAKLCQPGRWSRGLKVCAAALRTVLLRPRLLSSSQGRWMAGNLAILLSRTASWHAVYAQLNIRVHVEFDYGIEIYARALAMRILGGVVVLDQRSHYYDNYDHTSNRPGDLAFISGPSGLRYYSPRLFEVNSIVLTGLSKDGESSLRDGARDTGEKSLPVVAILDEPGTLYGPEHAIDFVCSVIEHCNTSGRYRIILKPKRAKDLLGKLPSRTASVLRQMIESGTARMLASETPVASVCLMSDLVVSVPSTAAYIAVGVGRPVLVYNPFHTIRTAFYEHGLDGQSIFVDIDVLLLELSRLVDSRGFDATTLLATRKALDPWLDMNGNERKGFFIQRLVQCLSDSLNASDAIVQTMKDYQGRYGAATCGNWQTVWDGLGDCANGLMLSPPRYDLSEAIGAH